MTELSQDDWLKIIPVMIAVILAFGGGIFTYVHKSHSDIELNQLDRINRQLRELYGPLYVTLKTSHEAWRSFRKRYCPEHGEKGYFGNGINVSDEEKLRWRTWMVEVFEPLNSRVETIVLENTDLFENGEIPDSILKALAPASSYKAIFAPHNLA